MAFDFKKTKAAEFTAPETTAAAAQPARVAPKLAVQKAGVHPLIRGISKQPLMQAYLPHLKAKGEKRGDGPIKNDANLLSWDDKGRYIVEIDKVSIEATATGKTPFKISVTVIEGDGDTPNGTKAEVVYWPGKGDGLAKQMVGFVCAVLNCPPDAYEVGEDGKPYAVVEQALNDAVGPSQTFVGKHALVSIDYNQGKKEMEDAPGFFPYFQRAFFDVVGERLENGSFAEVQDCRYGGA